MKVPKPKLSKLLAPFLVMLLVAIFGCASFQDFTIPTFVEEEAKIYAEDDAKSALPWPTLWDAKRLAVKMARKHELEQRELSRLIEDDTSHYAHLAEQQLIHVQDAEEFKTTIFSPGGPVGFLLPTLTAFGLGAVMISKPGDKKKVAELDVLKANGAGAAKPAV